LPVIGDIDEQPRIRLSADDRPDGIACAMPPGARLERQ
jgi:hypothetical protein